MKHGNPSSTGHAAYAARISEAMFYRGVTTEELSEKTGISVGMLREMITTIRPFTSLKLALIAEALNISTDDLYAEENPWMG